MIGTNVNRNFVMIKLIKGLYLLRSRQSKTKQHQEIKEASNQYLLGLQKIKISIKDSISSFFKIQICKKRKLSYEEKLVVKGSKLVYRDLNIFAIIK